MRNLRKQIGRVGLSLRSSSLLLLLRFRIMSIKLCEISSRNEVGMQNTVDYALRPFRALKGLAIPLNGVFWLLFT